MIRSAIVAALLLAASPALAGSITITVVNDAGATVGTRAYTISTAHILRLVAVMKSRYGQIATGPADPATGVVPMRDRTNAEALTAWLNGFMQGTVDAVAADEKASAAGTAAAAVAPITAN